MKFREITKETQFSALVPYLLRRKSDITEYEIGWYCPFDGLITKKGFIPDSYCLIEDDNV